MNTFFVQADLPTKDDHKGSMPSILLEAQEPCPESQNERLLKFFQALNR